MNTQAVTDTASTLAAGDKGPLAMGENSSPTSNNRRRVKAEKNEEPKMDRHGNGSSGGHALGLSVNE